MPAPDNIHTSHRRGARQSKRRVGQAVPDATNLHARVTFSNSRRPVARFGNHSNQFSHPTPTSPQQHTHHRVPLASRVQAP